MLSRHERFNEIIWEQIKLTRSLLTWSGKSERLQSIAFGCVVSFAKKTNENWNICIDDVDKEFVAANVKLAELSRRDPVVHILGEPSSSYHRAVYESCVYIVNSAIEAAGIDWPHIAGTPIKSLGISGELQGKDYEDAIKKQAKWSPKQFESLDWPLIGTNLDLELAQVLRSPITPRLGRLEKLYLTALDELGDGASINAIRTWFVEFNKEQKVAGKTGLQISDSEVTVKRARSRLKKQGLLNDADGGWLSDLGWTWVEKNARNQK